MNEARLEQTGAGLIPAEEGWFVLNVRDALWVTGEKFGSVCLFDGPNELFTQVGYRLRVLMPGQPNGMYHHEANQEDFLVLAGECLLLVEGEERRLRAWDFVHCPGGTDHIFVGAGTGPCVLFMAGSRENWPEGEGRSTRAPSWRCATGPASSSRRRTRAWPTQARPNGSRGRRTSTCPGPKTARRGARRSRASRARSGASRSMIGSRAAPFVVSSYSTRGGDSG